MEQTKASKFQMFSRGFATSKSAGQDHSCQSGMTSSGGRSTDRNASSFGGSSSGLGDARKGRFASKLGFKFDVANFDINAVSPTSW